MTQVKATVKLFAHGAPKKMAANNMKADPGAFGLVVGNPNGTQVTIMGTRANGETVDISGVASLAVTSSDESVATAAVSGMQYNISLLKAGDVTFHVVATWNDGSVGPFSIDDPCSVADAPPGPVTGLVATHGTPVVV